MGSSRSLGPFWLRSHVQVLHQKSSASRDYQFNYGLTVGGVICGAGYRVPPIKKNVDENGRDPNPGRGYGKSPIQVKNWGTTLRVGEPRIRMEETLGKKRRGGTGDMVGNDAYHPFGPAGEGTGSLG